MFLLLITIFLIKTSLISCGVFRDVIDDINYAQKLCHDLYTDNSELQACLHEGLMDKLHLLDATGRNIQLPRMHAIYRPIATQCVEMSQTYYQNEFSQKFLPCFLEQAAKYFREKELECDQMYPLDGNDRTFETMEEMIENNKNVACRYSCAADIRRIFTENDEFNQDSLRMNSNVPIDIQEAAELCYEQHQQIDRCKRRAFRVKCLRKAYQEALYAKNKPEIVEINFDEGEVYH